MTKFDLSRYTLDLFSSIVEWEENMLISAMLSRLPVQEVRTQTRWEDGPLEFVSEIVLSGGHVYARKCWKFGANNDLLPTGRFRRADFHIRNPRRF